MAPRHFVLAELGDALAAVHAPDRLTRIGIDGVDGAGKTRLAEELAQALTARRRQAVRITLDRSSRRLLSGTCAATSRPRGITRYMPAQQRYIEEQRPRERATFVLRNVREPELVRQQRPR